MPEMKFGGMAEVTKGKMKPEGISLTLGKKFKQIRNQSQLDEE